MKTCDTCHDQASWSTPDHARFYCWECVMSFGILAIHLEDKRTPTAEEVGEWFNKQKERTN